jgi:hypothetical protein
MKNWIELAFEYLIDLAEPPFVTKIHSPPPPLAVPMTEPVQPEPSKNSTVADIAGEAETRRAMVMKENLNCIMTGGLDSF